MVERGCRERTEEKGEREQSKASSLDTAILEQEMSEDKLHCKS